jgi:phage tail sheath protein FI
MANPPRTPGVYVEEIATLPPSVSEVSTAIPAFIGYTATVPLSAAGAKEFPYIARINTLLEYETLFEGAKPSGFKVTTREIENNRREVATISRNTSPSDPLFLMYYSLSLYFQNGGGSCYVVAVGDYSASLSRGDFEKGLAQLAMEDEPTLILFPDAVNLSASDYYTLCQAALAQCEKLKDRFCVFDVHNKADTTYKKGPVAEFREGIQNNYLKYGAAYHPYIQTTLPYAYKEAAVSVKPLIFEKTFGEKGIMVRYTTDDPSHNPSVKIVAGTDGQPLSSTISPSHVLTIENVSSKTNAQIIEDWPTTDAGKDPQGFTLIQVDDNAITPTAGTTGVPLDITFEKTFGENGITVSSVGSRSTNPKVKILAGTASQPITFTVDSPRLLTINHVSGKTGAQIVQAWPDSAAAQNPQGFAVTIAGTGENKVDPTSGSTGEALLLPTLESLKSSNTALYNQIKAALTQEWVVLPPSPAIAGVYASIDRARGVWKAPANVSLASVIGPVAKITNDEQDLLNVDPSTGKSINAIRAFTGKGTLVWGARTLAGNDNEWRYINVRRLFNVIEESIQKATAFAVFEANDATTWLKVKAMIESYLFGLWERGALAGPTPAAAYFVNVGLGKTMTNQDILEGRMNVKVGVAAVRPAEFIILTFSHKLQEA